MEGRGGGGRWRCSPKLGGVIELGRSERIRGGARLSTNLKLSDLDSMEGVSFTGRLVVPDV